MPNKDIKSAQQSKQLPGLRLTGTASSTSSTWGRMGVEHALLPEQGIVTAGDCIIGADSHTCTYGAVGAFSTGVGSTDMAAGMASGKAWFKVPAAIQVELKGALHPPVAGKDVILHLIGEIGVSGALYKSLEFVGEGVRSLTMEDRLCICNMAIEAGAKNGIFPVDETCEAYLKARSQRPWKAYAADPDAEYERTVVIDLDALEPTVSYPHLPENTHPARDGKDIKIDQVVIGSCTNGRIEDMEAAYNILKGRKIANGVRGIIIPATMAVYRECIVRGYTTAFVDAGLHRLHPHLRPLPGRLHGHSGRGGAVRLHHQPQLCGPHGACGFRGLSGQPRHRRRQRADRLYHRPAGCVRRYHERKRHCFPLRGQHRHRRDHPRPLFEHPERPGAGGPLHGGHRQDLRAPG